MEAKVRWTAPPKVNPQPTLLKEMPSKTITLEPFSMSVATVTKQ